MKCRSRCLLLILLCLLAFPFRSPAPFVYQPGEGWTYEPVGSEGKWQRTSAKEQLAVAQTAFDKKDYSLALKAARRVVSRWGLSDYAPQAQYLVARCYQASHREEKAFKAYQQVIEKYPTLTNYSEIQQRQFDIANLYLGGKWFKLWGYIPFFPSMEKTSDMFTKVVKNGPFSEIGPQAQLKIGAAREKQKDLPKAVKAYELAADRYHDRPQVAAEALYREGLAYHKQAQSAEYDQNTAGQAISTFTDFITLYPDDTRAGQAQSIITTLRHEQARGNYQIGKFYEKYHKWAGARAYYAEVVNLDPESPYAAPARRRVDELNKKLLQPAKP